MSASLSSVLQQALHENHVLLSEDQSQKLLHFLQLIQKWNQVFNLTAIIEPHSMVYLHIIDSLLVSAHLVGQQMLDVGSGAGLPGIPLAIIDPTKNWILLDKNSKKTRFLTQVVAELKLNNVEVIHARCEDFHPQKCFDSILSRAFGSIRSFVEATEHLLCPNGLFIAMKGKYPQKELQDLPNRFVLVKDVTHLDLKGIAIERHIACLSLKGQLEEDETWEK